MNKLSVLISFKNEREELAKTCKSIRDTAGDKVDILLLNDDSDKDFDYYESVKPYNVEYYVSDKRLGSSLGKQTLTSLCKTPYFLILDSHCRIYTKDWLDKALSILEENENAIYCCKVQYFIDDNDHEDPKHTIASGAYFNYNIKSLLQPVWNLKVLDSEKPFEIPCILGANYLCSKRWWDYLGGYNGLILYGREETFISKKSWMAGGSVKCIPTIKTGHKVRPGNHQPYVCNSYEVVQNELVTAYILIPEIFGRLVNTYKNIYDSNVFNTGLKLFNLRIKEIESAKIAFEKIKKFPHSYSDEINKEFQKKIGFNYQKLKKEIKGTFNVYRK